VCLVKKKYSASSKTFLSLASFAACAGLVLLSTSVWASDGVGSVDRLPFVSLGLCITLIGMVVAQVQRAWWELSALLKPLRVVGATIASIGVFMVAFGATEAPPTAGELPWLDSWQEALTKAETSQKTIMIDFQATWCAACHELESEVFHQPEVSGRLRDEFVLVRVDFDQDTDEVRMLAEKFRVSGLPTVGFASPDGTVLERPSFEGKIPLGEFIQRIDLAQEGVVAGKEDTELARALKEHGIWTALVLVFLAGLMSSLTPCVYPLIPITIGLFGARTAATRMQGFRLSFVYVMGIVLTYSVLGVVAASAGSVFGGAMQSPWVIGAISLLFVVLGLGSLGLFQMRLPAALQNRLGMVHGSGYWGAFFMGLVAGVIAAPCVGPIVAGILLLVAAEQDVFLGFTLLATFAFGMGQLFLILGTFSSALARLPKSGGWMDGVKTVFGIVFIGMGLYYGRFLLPAVSSALKEVWLYVA
jgi:thiol:disulfide interchange protein